MKINTEEYHDFNELIDESKKDLSDYIEKRLSLAKLKTYEKVANVSSRVLYGTVMLLFVVILAFLLLLTTGLYLGRLLNDYAAGFGILILVSLFMMLMVALNRKKVRRFLVNLTLRTIKKIESDED